MNKEQIFLMKYGLHNFVTCVKKAGKNTFLIKKTERENMIHHAKSLILGGYGEGTDIRLV